jgi:superoxide dismutase, Cu-Zn family
MKRSKVMSVVRNIVLLGLLSFSMTAMADSIVVDVSTVAQLAPAGHPIGSVKMTDTKYGLLIEPHLSELSPGVHGFHLHETPLCDNYGLAARGHYDPDNTGKHLGPYDDTGHLGDLPALTADNKGQANLVILAPRLTVNQVYGRALMVHLGGDNYSDIPEKMGGGEDRVACGIIKGVPKVVKTVAAQPKPVPAVTPAPALATQSNNDTLDDIPDLKEDPSLSAPVKNDAELEQIDNRLRRLFDKRNQ